MRNFILLITLVLALPITGFSQSKKAKSFSGMLEYKISVRDSSLRELVPDNRMIVYSNDTIVRIENFTKNLGKQVAIKHMHMDKSYLLLETDFGKFAIQMDESEAQEKAQATDTTTVDADNYVFKKKCGKKRLLGRKMNRLVVSNPDFGEPIEFLYMKGYSTEMVNAYPEINGIPTKYSVITPDAIFDYELVKINEYTPKHDLFGIPSDFERVSFNDFMDKMIDSKAGNRGE
ncbi:MAG: hypothetical protein HRT58_06245 [Crocinitomicaceae bacterium]|nr:hypothetical protein [Flavobacteriales bacterium]NQZ35244.1 hypothetical protein [Crocinitomicaceae bacterium]